MIDRSILEETRITRTGNRVPSTWSNVTGDSNLTSPCLVGCLPEIRGNRVIRVISYGRPGTKGLVKREQSTVNRCPMKLAETNCEQKVKNRVWSSIYNILSFHLPQRRANLTLILVPPVTLE